MASISGATTSLGNTSLQGYGGMVSGIDRDSIIEQMTLGTTTKITNVEKQMTELEWKQEAYQNLTDQILDLEDNYFTFTSSLNLKSSSVFAADIISAVGDDAVTKYISAKGTSAMLANMSVLGVKQTATATTVLSEAKGGDRSITTKIQASDLNKVGAVELSALVGKTLKFGHYGTEGNWISASDFTFAGSYTKAYDYTVNDDGTVTAAKRSEAETVTINYNAAPEELVKQLNESILASGYQVENGKTIQFAYDSDTDSISIKYMTIDNSVVDEAGNRKIELKATTDNPKGTVIRADSSALSGLGFQGTATDNKISFVGADNDFEKGVLTETGENGKAIGNFSETYITEHTMAEYLAGKSVTVSYGGQSASIQLLTQEELELIQPNGDKEGDLDVMVAGIQDRLDKAFGSGKVSVEVDVKGFVAFKAMGGETLTVNAADTTLRKNLDLLPNQSNRVSVDASLWDNREVLGFTEYTDDEAGKAAFNEDLAKSTINGVSLADIAGTEDVSKLTVNQLISKINSNKEVGVNASYLSSTGQFVLVAEQTGSGRDITLEGEADIIFTGAAKNDSEDNPIEYITAGQDASMTVRYGNAQFDVTSSTNTFNLDGLEITVSGAFGYTNGTLDSTKAVTFEAKADAEGVTEQVKTFIEAYNKIISDLYDQISTRPSRSYGALTDEQKDEMTEDEIEKWEKKAKEGILYNESSVKNLYSDLQNVVNVLMANGVSYSDLESIGITTSDSKADYGKLIFNESKFKQAMETDPEKVSNIFTGGGNVKKGLSEIIEDTLTPYATRYATRNGNSYGRLVEEAGSEKLVLSKDKNFIYNELQRMEEEIERLRARLKSEQDRYISQFTNMESVISKYNTQSSYIAGLSS